MNLSDKVAPAESDDPGTRTEWWVLRCLVAAFAAAWVVVLVWMWPR